ncbi:MAG: lamin tail domain-containing protein, partial [Candidatus Moraniibacteriota bacterium]
MSTRFILALIVLILIAPTPVFAAVMLSEIQIAGAKTSDEFVELYNSGEESVNLSGWSLRRKSASDTTATGSSLKTFGSTDSLPAHGYFLWANSASVFKDHADTTTGSSLSDNNSLALYDKSGVLTDSMTWGTGHALSFSPTQFENPAAKEGFTRDISSLAWIKSKSPTPTNSKGEVFKDDSGTAETSSSPYIVRINEVLPNPKEKGDAGEFIELYNPGTELIDLSGWEIHDASATGKYVFPSSISIPPLSYLVITDQEFSLSLNNSNETLSLYDKEERLVHRVQYEKTKEGVSLNLVGAALRGARKPTPGAANSENTDPVTKERVPKKGYRNFAIEFRARGKDSDGDKLKFTWDFGDGHKSYKENTSHKYVKSGRYTITLTTDDSIDVTKETFAIKVEKYRAPEVRITALLPNPKGNDSKLEWIEIENREKHAINLSGFSIATGTKKKSITNHPIREDFIIPPKSVKRLTREFSLFTLGNERGHVELRSPDGQAVQHLKYKFEKSLSDNTVLKKEKGQSLITVTAPAEPTTEEIAENSAEQASVETVEATQSQGDGALPPTSADETSVENSTPPPVE